MSYHDKRYRKSIELVKKYIPPGSTVCDLGNKKWWHPDYITFGTGEMDLDTTVCAHFDEHPYFTAFEVLEHLVNPVNILNRIGGILIATVPFGMWFTRAYRGPHSWDEHYHEFEDWQFDKLLDFCGWEIIHREYWYYGMRKVGIRPFLRLFWPSYYAVVARRK